MITLGEDALAKVKSGATTRRGAVPRRHRGARKCGTLCPGCHAAVGVDFMACPHCGHRLNAGCPKCGRSLQAGWQFCPYCTTQHRRAKPTQEAAARSAQDAASCRRRTSPNSRTRTIVEKLLRHAARCARDAPADEIKKAFRREIARYHPDKVQHLGQEFQEMAVGHRRRSHRGLPDPDGSGAAREVQRRSVRRRRRRPDRRDRRRRQPARAESEPPPPPPPRRVRLVASSCVRPGQPPTARARRRPPASISCRRRACRA